MRVLLALGLILALAGCRPAGPVPPKVAVEFRVAEERPGPGLTEMTVAGGDLKVYVRGEVLLVNADIKSAALGRATSPGGQPQIEVAFTKAGRAKFAAATEQLIGKQIAILIDGRLVSAPFVRERIAGGRAVITGAFSREEAQRIADGLAGAR